MSTDLQFGFTGARDKTPTEAAEESILAKRFQDNRLLIYQQADDAITAGQAVMLDTAASASGQKIAPCAATSDTFYGIAEKAFTDEYYGWVTVAGQAEAQVADGVAVGDKLIPGASGVLVPYEGRGLINLQGNFNGGGTLADGTTYAIYLLPGVAGVVKAIKVIANGVPGDGTSTIKFEKATAGGNTMISAASYDPTGLTTDVAASMTLTSTAADLALTATQGIYCEFVVGTVTIQPSQVCVLIDFLPDAVDHKVVALAHDANSSGDTAVRTVHLL